MGKFHECSHLIGGEPCGEQFSIKRLLEEHERSKHTFEKPFWCEECDTRFRRAGDYAKHQQEKHEGRRRYVCGGEKDVRKTHCCGEGFTRSNQLHSHYERWEATQLRGSGIFQRQSSDMSVLETASPEDHVSNVEGTTLSEATHSDWSNPGSRKRVDSQKRVFSWLVNTAEVPGYKAFTTLKQSPVARDEFPGTLGSFHCTPPPSKGDTNQLIDPQPECRGSAESTAEVLLGTGSWGIYSGPSFQYYQHNYFEEHSRRGDSPLTTKRRAEPPKALPQAPRAPLLSSMTFSTIDIGPRIQEKLSIMIDRIVFANRHRLEELSKLDLDISLPRFDAILTNKIRRRRDLLIEDLEDDVELSLAEVVSLSIQKRREDSERYRLLLYESLTGRLRTIWADDQTAVTSIHDEQTQTWISVSSPQTSNVSDEQWVLQNTQLFINAAKAEVKSVLTTDWLQDTLLAALASRDLCPTVVSGHTDSTTEVVAVSQRMELD